MRKLKIAGIVSIFSALILSVVFTFAQADTIYQLNPFTTTTTPQSSITQNVFGKPLKITGLSTLRNICLSSSGLATTTGCPAATPGGSNGQIEYNNNGVFAGIPGSAVNSGSGNLSLSGDIAFQAGNNIYGLGTLNFTGSGANDVVDISNLYFDGQGGGIQNFGDSTALFGAILDGNSGTLIDYSYIGSILNYLDDGSGNAFISGLLTANSISSGQITGTNINGTTLTTSGDITSSGGSIVGGYRMTTVAQGANYVAIPGDSEISMDASTGAHTITLPLIGTMGAGKTLYIQKTDSTNNAVTINKTGTNTINGSATGYSITLPNQWVILLAVNSNWQVFASGVATVNGYDAFGTVSPTPKCAGVACIDLAGSDNTTNGITMNTVNTNAGTSAYSGYTLGNDKYSFFQYAGMYLNSSTYSDTTFGTGNSLPNELQIGSTLGPISIQAASTTNANSYINFLTGGVDSTNERARITRAGNFGIGTTSPYATTSIQSNSSVGDAFVVATSTRAAIGGYDNDGHRFTSGPAPAISSCGTGSGTVVGDDQGGVITTATAATTCTLTFSKAYRLSPYCTVTDNSLVGFADVASVSTSAVTFGISSALTGGNLYYQCSYHK